tara:strand:+ start:1254 stop:1640 length:387 start_codon:yes stop_codon:yes gene_type:complete
MSTLKVNTIQDTSGSNSSTPSQLNNGTAKAWCNFDGSGTVNIRNSYNISSLTDNGTGNYTLAYTTSMADANDAAVGWGMRNFNSDSNYTCWRKQAHNAASITVRSSYVWSSGGTATDLHYYYVVVFSA